MRKMLHERKLDDSIEVDSAGTHGYRVGEPPDPRSQRAAVRRGYDLSDLRARKIAALDLDYFDLILAMDQNNVDSVKQYASDRNIDKIRLLMDFAQGSDRKEIPDPYYSLGQDFDTMFDLIEQAIRGVLDYITRPINGNGNLQAGFPASAIEAQSSDKPLSITRPDAAELPGERPLDLP